MTKIIAVLNQKGGVGKTTTSNALGLGLSAKGYKVLLIDLDAQGNLSMSLGTPFPDDEQKTMAQLLQLTLQEQEYNINDYINRFDKVDYLIGNDDLGKIDRMLAGWRDGEYVLSNILKPMSEQYDYIIIDCMPSVGMLTENAIVSADEIIIPSEPQFFSVKGIQSLLDEIGKIKRRKNPNLKIVGILPTKVDMRLNVSKAFMTTLKEVFSGNVRIFDTYIPVSTKLAECNAGSNMYEYDKNGKGVLAYKSFVDEYLNN